MSEYWDALQDDIKETKAAVEDLNKHLEKIYHLQKIVPQERAERHEELKQIVQELEDHLEYYELKLQDLIKEESIYEYYCS